MAVIVTILAPFDKVCYLGCGATTGVDLNESKVPLAIQFALMHEGKSIRSVVPY